MPTNVQKTNILNKLCIDKPELIEQLFREYEYEHYHKSKNGQSYVIRCPLCLKENDGEIHWSNNYCRGSVFYHNDNKPINQCGWICYQDKRHYCGTGKNSTLVGFFNLLDDGEPYNYTLAKMTEILNIDWNTPFPSINGEPIQINMAVSEREQVILDKVYYKKKKIQTDTSPADIERENSNAGDKDLESSRARLREIIGNTEYTNRKCGALGGEDIKWLISHETAKEIIEMLDIYFL